MANSLAVYLRLSQDDVDMKGNALKDESDSIHSQRLLIHRYISEHTDLGNLPILEFVDDGFTGTNFNRPEFQRMLAMVRDGVIGCIIVKDLSRFGRNYLEVGDYLEHIFPFLNVRFIAVNDNYDSNSYMGTTGGIDVAFRNLIYQRYSQDLSEKVKSAMHLKMSKGKYITHCPYGYRKKPGVKHEMIPDPGAAPIVREIFQSAIAGMKSTEIAAMLNERQIPTPMVYKRLSRKDMHNDAMWSHQAVLRIIKDYKYTGAMVNFKCENETIRATVQRRRSPDEWVVVENSHEAIVSHEEYEAANATIRKVNYVKPVRTKRRDQVYYCAYCGRRLRKTFGSDEYYSCATRLYRPDSPCCKVKWSRTEIEDVVLAAYRAQLALMTEEYQKMQAVPQADPVDALRSEARKAEQELNGFQAKNLSLYEQYRGGEMDKGTFIQKKNLLLQRKEQLQGRLAELQEEEDAAIRRQEEEVVQKEALQASAEIMTNSDDELKELMYDAIEKVVVYATRELEIQWRFSLQKKALCPKMT